MVGATTGTFTLSSANYAVSATINTATLTFYTSYFLLSTSKIVITFPSEMGIIANTGADPANSCVISNY